MSTYSEKDVFSRIVFLILSASLGFPVVLRFENGAITSLLILAILLISISIRKRMLIDFLARGDKERNFAYLTFFMALFLFPGSVIPHYNEMIFAGELAFIFIWTCVARRIYDRNAGA
tara:strand:- start:268 stop:621 length:354 start_codon:yes stop_codon:yes gene_type:complete